MFHHIYGQIPAKLCFGKNLTNSCDCETPLHLVGTKSRLFSKITKWGTTLSLKKVRKWVDNILNSKVVFPFLIQERWGDLMKTNCEVLSWREAELFSFELINKLVRELSPIYRLNFYQLLLFFCQKIQLQLLLSFFCCFFFTYILLCTFYFLIDFTFYLHVSSYFLLDGWRGWRGWRG